MFKRLSCEGQGGYKYVFGEYVVARLLSTRDLDFLLSFNARRWGNLKFRFSLIPQVYLKIVNFFACVALVQLGYFKEGRIWNFGVLAMLTWRWRHLLTWHICWRYGDLMNRSPMIDDLQNESFQYKKFSSLFQ